MMFLPFNVSLPKRNQYSKLFEGMELRWDQRYDRTNSRCVLFDGRHSASVPHKTNPSINLAHTGSMFKSAVILVLFLAQEVNAISRGSVNEEKKSRQLRKSNGKGKGTYINWNGAFWVNSLLNKLYLFSPIHRIWQGRVRQMICSNPFDWTTRLLYRNATETKR